MPPKPNGFYMFMSAKQREIKSRTNRAPTMREMPAICKDEWKALSAAEKARYDSMAKQERGRQQNSEGFAKLDCHRQVIADRVDPVKVEKERRSLERNLLLNSFQRHDVTEMKFHILDFQVMYDDVLEDQHFPVEIGMVAINLRDGVGDFLHRFIDPGEVPQGNRHLALSHAENYHKIPLQFEHADGNFRALTNHMSDFISADSNGDEIPPVFCLQIHRRMIENCLDFIYSKVYVPEAGRYRVFCLEDLVKCLIVSKTNKQPSESQVTDMLMQNRWDYTNSIRCFFHQEVDCAFCSLSIVRRYSFAMFDAVASLFQITLTDKHLPDDMEEIYSVTSSVGFGNQAARGAPGDMRRNPRASNNWSDTGSYSSRSDPPPPGDSPWKKTMQSNAAWQPPRVDPVKVPLSDDDYEEDEEEVRPKAGEYSLEKLRLPKSLSQVQTQVGGLNIHSDDGNHKAPASTAGMARGIWRGPNTGAPIRPVGRGAAPPRMQERGQVRPMGRGTSSVVMPPPPPGFERPPMMGYVPSPQPQRQPAPMVPNDFDFPALGGRGRGIPRGRGILPSHQ